MSISPVYFYISTLMAALCTGRPRKLASTSTDGPTRMKRNGREIRDKVKQGQTVHTTATDREADRQTQK